jgi:hypothetical protein
MEPDAVPPVSRLVYLEHEIEELKVSAALWHEKAAAAASGSEAEQSYLKALSEANAQLLELRKQRGALVQIEAGEWWLGRQAQLEHTDPPGKAMLQCLNSYTSREGVRQQGLCQAGWVVKGHRHE